MKVPFYDLAREHAAIKQEVMQGIEEVYEKGQFILGPELKNFETAFADYIGDGYGLGVANGLDALRLALESLGIKAGDEVIVPAHTFIATWLAVSLVGATPIPVEPDELSYNIDPLKIENHITKKTKAIIAVHLYGLPADMEAINAIANKHDLFVIEDAAQAQGAMIGDKRCGSFSDVAAFSFYPGKNIGALGDAGFVFTPDAKRAGIIARSRNYGSEVKYQHESKGINSRLDEIQAVVLQVKLKHLDGLNAKRRLVAEAYLNGIKNTSIQLPVVESVNRSVWHQFVVRCQNREAFIAHLQEKNIQTQLHYPLAPHQTKAYQSNPSMQLPLTEELSATVVSLPMFPFLKQPEIQYVIDAINGFHG